MNDIKIYCEDYDFSDLAAAFGGEVRCDCTLSAEIFFTDEQGIRELNARTRSVDSVTDVLSYPSFDGDPEGEILQARHPFETDEDGCVFIGSIVICRKRAEEQAAEYGHSVEREINYLAAHGVCHLLGYDHIEEADKAKMREKEEKVLAKIHLTREDT